MYVLLFLTSYEIFLYYLYLLGYEKNEILNLHWNEILFLFHPPLYITDDGEEELNCGLLSGLTWCFYVELLRMLNFCGGKTCEKI